jgi:hypothetical protein
MAASIRLGEQESKGLNDELIALIVADMHEPVTPCLTWTPRKPLNCRCIDQSKAMRTVILLMGGLQNASCCKETYISDGLSSIARGLFRVRL